MPQRAHEIPVRHIDAALALDRLEQHRHDVWIVRGELLDCRQIVKGHAHKTGHQRLEAGLHLAVAGGRKRRQGAAVEGLFHDDDRGLLDALLVSVHARQLDRGFVGLATGIAEEHLVHAGQRGETIGSGFRLADAIQVRRMHEAADLLAQSLDQSRMIVAQRVDRDSRQGIEIGLALLVEQAATLPVGKGDRQPRRRYSSDAT